MPRNDAALLAADRRKQLVASLLARNPRISRRQIRAALALPLEQGGIRNPLTEEPYSLGTVQADIEELRGGWRLLREKSVEEWLEQELMMYEELQIQAWRNGDLSEVRRISEARRKMLGLDAPAKFAPTTPDGGLPFESTVIHVMQHFDPDDTDEGEG